MNAGGVPKTCKSNGNMFFTLFFMMITQLWVPAFAGMTLRALDPLDKPEDDAHKR
jgi:hypothetical protein